MVGGNGPLAPAPTAALEDRLSAVESRLAALGNALRSRDAAGIDLHASELHRALASAVSHFSDAAKAGPLPPALRARLAQASGQVAAQRESLARATAALDRAIDVLLPREGAALYSIYGAADRGVFKSGVIRARGEASRPAARSRQQRVALTGPTAKRSRTSPAR